MSGSDGMSEYNVEAAVARIEGMINNQNVKLDHIVEDNKDIKRRINTHADRLHNLELQDTRSAGKTEGIVLTAKAVWAVVALIGLSAIGGLVSAFVQVFGQ